MKNCSAFKIKTLLVILISRRRMSSIGDLDTNGSTLRNKIRSMVLVWYLRPLYEIMQ